MRSDKVNSDTRIHKLEAISVAWPTHESECKSAYIYWKHLPRKSNPHQSQFTNSALATLPYPREQALLALSGNSPPPSQSCFVSLLPLLQSNALSLRYTHYVAAFNLYKTSSCSRSLRNSVLPLARHHTLPLHGLFSLKIYQTH